MELVQPAMGLVFWMTVSFLIVMFILKKYAWGPILNALKDREYSIEVSLGDARKAREDIALVKLQSEELKKESQVERASLIKDARDMKNQIIAEAKKKAKEEADKVLRQAREEINNERKAAMADIKVQVASLSIDIAEKILKSELSEDKKQKALISNLVEEIQLN
jgi:F-type H+-transporting ATPase subunit b